MNPHDDERLVETADLPPLPLEPAPRREQGGKSRPPPPSDKLVFGPVARSDAPAVPPEPPLDSDPAD